MQMNDEDKFIETITANNGEMLTVLASLFDLSPDDIDRWGIVITSHVDKGPPRTMDIRVASNCEDSDIAVLLNMGIRAL